MIKRIRLWWWTIPWTTQARIRRVLGFFKDLYTTFVPVVAVIVAVLVCAYHMDKVVASRVEVDRLRTEAVEASRAAKAIEATDCCPHCGHCREEIVNATKD